MIYCNNCILPNTRPNIFILKNGVCSACDYHLKKKINWNKRKSDFKSLVKKIKKKKLLYDCLIPVSGGKDSTWQVLIAKKFGLNPLGFTYRPPLRNKIGQKNLDNLKKIGLHHIEFSVDIDTERKFIKKSFLNYGAVAIPFHMAMWNMSINLAQKFNIPLIIWGENSAREYGGSHKDRKLKNLNKEWISKYGVNFNTTIFDWIDKDLSKKNLAPFVKEKENSSSKKIKSIFLGDYFKWDPERTYKFSKKHGFKNLKGKVKTGIYDYADLDDNLISIHHYLKIFKFGFSRSFDNLSLEIRNKRLSRSKAIEIIKKKGFKKPTQDIKTFCKFVNISASKFESICEKFRNKKIWIRNSRKRWKLKFPLR